MQMMLVTKAEAAAALSISIRQLELYVRNGQIAVRKLGPRCVRIEQSELTRFIEKLSPPKPAA
jgi:predicted site-specific integrase-resolvase